MLFKEDIAIFIVIIIILSQKNILLPYDQHNCWEWEEWMWRIQHHLVNICHSALLLAVNKEECPIETIILKLHLKKSKILLYVCILVSLVDSLELQMQPLFFSHLVLNIQYMWLPLESTLKPKSSKYLNFNTPVYSNKYLLKNFSKLQLFLWKRKKK